MDHAVLVHVLTKKGKGYKPAEENPARFHGVEPFDIKTGKALRTRSSFRRTQMCFLRSLCQLAGEESENCRCDGGDAGRNGTHGSFGRRIRSGFLMWESRRQHAVTSAAGMAAAGLKPVVAVYSSFMQRGI